jgi:nucleotide-binding universal stress UspA family protein
MPVSARSGIAASHARPDHAEHRSGTGDAATVIGQIAAEGVADVIVVSPRKRGPSHRGLDSRLAEQLGRETRLPVVIAPPERRGGKVAP